MAKKKKRQRAKSSKAAATATAILPPGMPEEERAGEAGGHSESGVQPIVARDEVPAHVTAAADLAVQEEHRSSQRISLEVELHLASDSHFFSGLSGDISEGGVFVSTYRELATGSLVDVEFSLPGTDRMLHARGEVRWQRDASPGAPPGVGIAFEELSEDDRTAIHRFCTVRPPLYYDDVG